MRQRNVVFMATKCDEISKSTRLWAFRELLHQERSFRQRCSFETIPAGQHAEDAAGNQPDTLGRQLWFNVQETNQFPTVWEKRAKWPGCDFSHFSDGLWTWDAKIFFLLIVLDRHHCLSLGRMRSSSSGFRLVELNRICTQRAFANLVIGHLNQWIKTNVLHWLPDSINWWMNGNVHCVD